MTNPPANARTSALPRVSRRKAVRPIKDGLGWKRDIARFSGSATFHIVSRVGETRRRGSRSSVLKLFGLMRMVVQDSVFGDVEYEYGWRRPYSYMIFGQCYSVSLIVFCHEGEDIDAVQREAFARFEGTRDRLAPVAADAIYDYYNECSREIRERVGLGFADQVAPLIDGVHDLPTIVKPTGVLVQQPLVDNERIIGLLFDCSWEPELGLAVKFENEILVEVGPQDIVL
jgi:hypothetical protein